MTPKSGCNWFHYCETTEAISTKFGKDRFWVLWLLYFDIFYSGTEKQVVAYDYAERLANGVMECQVCFDSKSFFSLFMKNLIKIILKFEYTNCIIVFSIVSFLTELFPLSRKLQNSCNIAILFKNNLGRFYYFTWK